MNHSKSRWTASIGFINHMEIWRICRQGFCAFGSLWCLFLGVFSVSSFATEYVAISFATGRPIPIGAALSSDTTESQALVSRIEATSVWRVLTHCWLLVVLRSHSAPELLIFIFVGGELSRGHLCLVELKANTTLSWMLPFPSAQSKYIHECCEPV